MEGVEDCLSLLLSQACAASVISTLSLHDALPIYATWCNRFLDGLRGALAAYDTELMSDELDTWAAQIATAVSERSEEHTSELQSQSNLVCRLLLEKKKPRTNKKPPRHDQN